MQLIRVVIRVNIQSVVADSDARADNVGAQVNIEPHDLFPVLFSEVV